MNRLSTREWLLIIGVLLLIEYFWLADVLQLAADERIVNYVGFAGTIVSIILALLAIIYSYYQSFSQRQENVALATQIEKLSGVVERANLAEAVISDELSKVSQISERVNQSFNLLRDSRTSMSEFQSQMREYVERVMMQPSPRRDVEVVELTSTQADHFLTNIGEYHRFFIYGLYMSADEEAEFNVRIDKYIVPAFAAVFSIDHKDTDEQLRALLRTSAYTLQIVLHGLGVLQFTDTTLDFKPAFSEILLQVAHAKHPGEPGRYVAELDKIVRPEPIDDGTTDSETEGA